MLNFVLRIPWHFISMSQKLPWPILSWKVGLSSHMQQRIFVTVMVYIFSVFSHSVAKCRVHFELIHENLFPLCCDCAESVFSAPFYLQNLLDAERFPNYPINDPVGFLNSLMQVNSPLVPFVTALIWIYYYNTRLQSAQHCTTPSL